MRILSGIYDAARGGAGCDATNDPAFLTTPSFFGWFDVADFSAVVYVHLAAVDVVDRSAHVDVDLEWFPWNGRSYGCGSRRCGRWRRCRGCWGRRGIPYPIHVVAAFVVCVRGLGRIGRDPPAEYGVVPERHPLPVAHGPHVDARVSFERGGDGRFAVDRFFLLAALQVVRLIEGNLADVGDARFGDREHVRDGCGRLCLGERGDRE